MSKYSLTPFVKNRPWLQKLLMPVANTYVNLCGYRKMGLKADDLISEEDEIVLKALKRLPPKEAFDRVYRIRRAIQLSVQQRILPKEEWIKDEEDIPYLSPLIEQILAEEKERADLDSLTIIRNK